MTLYCFDTFFLCTVVVQILSYLPLHRHTHTHYLPLVFLFLSLYSLLSLLHTLLSFFPSHLPLLLYIAPTTHSTNRRTTLSSSSPKHHHPSTSPKPSNPQSSATSSQQPAAMTKSGSIDTDSERSVPVVSAGRTSDTYKWTVTPAADHSTMRFSSDTQQTGTRTNPGHIQSIGPKKTPVSSGSGHTDKSHLEKTDRLGKKMSADDHDPPPHHLPITSLQEASLECQAVLLAKLRWCSKELETSPSVENSILLCRLVSSIVEALKALKDEPLSSLPPSARTGPDT